MAKKPDKLQLLEIAFDTIWLVNDQVRNVIASGDFTKEDLKLKRDTDKFIKHWKILA